MLDEEQLKARASALILAGTTAEADAKSAQTATSQKSADASLDGLHVELDSAGEKHQTLAGQRARRVIKTRQSKEEHALKFFKGSSNNSIEDAINVYVRAGAEDVFMADVLALSQQAVHAARAAVIAGEIDSMKADLAHKESAVVVLAIKHAEVAAKVAESDPGIELSYGPVITSALDSIVILTTEIARKERGLL